MRHEDVGCRNVGFSLVELLFVVAIVALLIAFAVPGYKNYVVKTKRTDAQGVLVSLAQEMERHFIDNQTYANTIDSDSAPAAPNMFSDQSPLVGQAVYNITVQAVSATTYTLRATPVEAAQVDDGYLELLSTGVRRWDKDNDDSIGADENCWLLDCS